MSSYEYLLLLSACVLITLPLEILFAARVYRRWKAALAALVPVIIVFSAWDVLAIARDHWTYNPRFVTGIDLGVLPLEELVFFIVIPICALLSYEAVGNVMSGLGTRRHRFRRTNEPAHEPSGDEQSRTGRGMEGTDDDRR